MAIVEEVRKMQQQGFNDEQIIQAMRGRGVDYKDIADSLSQSRIKAAVEQPDADPSNAYSGSPQAGSQEGMEPSIMNNRSEPEELAPPSPGAGSYAPQLPQGGYVVQQPQEYSTGQGQYTEGYGQQYTQSSDLTTEIAEQVVAERLGEMRKYIEKIADMKTTVEARIEFLDERLKRIEKIIDVLQSSVLRKVGDYVTNVDDIKRELIETQKTFAKLLPERRTSSDSTPQHKQQHHPPQHQGHQNHPGHPQHKR